MNADFHGKEKESCYDVTNKDLHSGRRCDRLDRADYEHVDVDDESSHHAGRAGRFGGEAGGG